MINREDFKLMAVGKYTLGKPTVKSEDYLLYLDGALFGYDLMQKVFKEDQKQSEAYNQQQIIYETKALE